MDSILEFTDKNKVPILLGLGGIVFVLLGLLAPSFSKSKTLPEITESGSSNSFIRVDVEGAVNKPGVHRVASDGRVEDALREAGGLNKEADRERIAETINLAAKLIDGQKIYFFQINDQSSPASSSTLININLATSKDLDTLPGIGPVTAEKIINARPFASIEDLKARKVVSNSVYEKIKDLISAN